jgi:hypothetical protein
MNRFILKMEAKWSLWNVILYIKDRTVDNVQNYDSYINMPLSKTCG